MKELCQLEFFTIHVLSAVVLPYSQHQKTNTIIVIVKFVAILYNLNAWPVFLKCCILMKLLKLGIAEQKFELLTFEKVFAGILWKANLNLMPANQLLIIIYLAFSSPAPVFYQRFCSTCSERKKTSTFK